MSFKPDATTMALIVPALVSTAIGGACDGCTKTCVLTAGCHTLCAHCCLCPHRASTDLQPMQTNATRLLWPYELRHMIALASTSYFTRLPRLIRDFTCPIYLSLSDRDICLLAVVSYHFRSPPALFGTSHTLLLETTQPALLNTYVGSRAYSLYILDDFCIFCS
jgi:hypothetical protein